MLQENLKNQRDSVKKGLDTRQTGHVILHYLAVYFLFNEFFWQNL